ncbi:MAG: hypothetical protein J1F39_02805 [Clostridiales bacterium]|nr:hypothetical protein [Clostridiales bacterium]
MGAMKIPSRARYRKRVGAFSAMNVSKDESVLDFSTAAECYNFDFSTGALADGYGVTAHKFVPSNATRYWVYRYYSEEHERYVEQFVYQVARGQILMSSVDSDDLLYLSGFAYPEMNAINYRLNSRDVLLLSCKGRHLYVWDGVRLVEHKDAPVISSMALHYERLFVTSDEEPTKVFFSDDLDPTNWSVSSGGAGFIELLDERGDLTKVVSFGGFLYLFREHGISRVTAYADQSEFSVTNLFVSAGRIFPESIVMCGAVIMFLASDGLYVFDGYECRKTLKNLDGLFGAKCSCGEYYNGKYYLSCEMNFSDGEKVGCENGEYTTNGLLVYDLSTGAYSVSRGVDISYLKSVSYKGLDYLVACDSDGCGVIDRCGSRLSGALHKLWRGPFTDFGTPDKTKSVREVYFDGSVPCTLTVTGDKKKKSAFVKSGARRLRTNVNTKKLALSISTDEVGCSIKAPTVIYSSY